MREYIDRALDFDLSEYSARYYARLGANKGIFAAAFALGIFTYFIFIAHMLPDNHASRFPWLIPGGIGSGRWFSAWIGHLHYDADLPVFLPVISIAFAVTAAMLIVRRWFLPLSAVSVFLVVAAAVAYPANLAFFYYTFMSPLFLGSVLLGAVGFYICDRFDFLRIAVAAVSVLLLLATYQMSINVVITVSVLAAIGQIMAVPTSGGVRGAAMTALARVLAVVAGGIAYRLSLAIMGVSPPRTIAYTSLSDLPGRIWDVVTQTWDSLFLTQPELLSPIKVTLLAIVAGAVVISLWKVRRSPLSLVAVAILWPAALIATKALFVAVIPDGAVWEYRFNLALGYFYVFALAVLLSSFTRRLWTSLAQAIAIFVVISFVQADLLRQGVLLRGVQHDLAVANRVLARMESLPDLDLSRTYDLIRVGHYSYYRLNLMRSRGRENAFDRLGDGHMDVGEISDRWVDEDVFRMLGSPIQFRFESTDPYFNEKVARVQAELLEGRRPWPAPESVFINGDEIIVYMRAE